MKLKFGMVGGGGGGIGASHVRGALLDFQCELIAGCFSRDIDRNKLWATTWGVQDSTRVYQDYETMAITEGAKTGDERLDFIVIVTPNNSHFKIAKTFMEQGFHIMCDKPLSSTIEQGEYLRKLALEKDLLFGLTYTYAGYAMIRQARELIDSGVIGDIEYINAEYPEEWLAVALATNKNAKEMWRLDPAQVGESQTTADIGTHSEYLIKAVTGLDPKRVIAKLNSIPNSLKLESNSTILLDYPNNVTGLIWVSQVAIGQECDIRIRVFGSKGSIDWNHLSAGTLKLAQLNQPAQIYSLGNSYNFNEANRLSRLTPGKPEGIIEAFGNIYYSFCQCLAAKKENRQPESYTFPSIEDGIIGLKFVHACVESNKNNNVWVEL